MKGWNVFKNFWFLLPWLSFASVYMMTWMAPNIIFIIKVALLHNRFLRSNGSPTHWRYQTKQTTGRHCLQRNETAPFFILFRHYIDVIIIIPGSVSAFALSLKHSGQKRQSRAATRSSDHKPGQNNQLTGQTLCRLFAPNQHHKLMSASYLPCPTLHICHGLFENPLHCCRLSEFDCWRVISWQCSPRNVVVYTRERQPYKSTKEALKGRRTEVAIMSLLKRYNSIILQQFILVYAASFL